MTSVFQWNYSLMRTARMIMHKTVHTAALILAESADSLIIQLTLSM